MRTSLAAALLLVSVSPATADNWPSWRGPTRDGISTEKGLPTAWSETENVLWKTPLPGPSGSTPVVWGDRIFLMSPSPDGGKVLLLCLGTDGKRRWEAVVAPKTSRAKDIAAPSPSTDGKLVWAYTGTGDLACFTVEGKKAWHANLQQRYGAFKLSFGMTSTPVVHDGKLYIQLLHAGAYLLVALDGATGKELWKVERTSDAQAECKHAYTSLQLWTGGDAPVLVVHGNDYTSGHAVADGRELWRLQGLNPKEGYGRTLRFVSSPLVTGDLIVVPTAKNKQVVAIHPSGAKELWRNPSGTPDVSSPLHYRGFVYFGHKNGAITCLDARTGKLHYSEAPERGSIYASPVGAGGHVYVANRRGSVAVLKPGPAYALVSLNRIEDGLDASPVVSNGRIYLRASKNLWAIGTK